MNYVIYAIPLFFVLIAVELIVDHARHTGYYRVNDAINSLSAGVLSQMTALVKQMIPFTFYLLAFDAIQVIQLPHAWWVWLFAFIAYDFFYYWNHRLGHEINLLWAAHVVHHSSEDYNLSTALRQTSGSFLSWLFYIPLAVLGIDPYILISVGSLNLIYQFWVHTQHVPKLGWFEWIFVSPSNHRVHHAQNQCYLDRNYGGVFIIWDRLFGTFQEELDHEKPVYGVRKALRTWNPIEANLQVYKQLASDAWRTEKWQDKLRIWLKPTGWRPADVASKYPLAKTDLNNFQKFDTPLSLLQKVYAIMQHSITVGLGLLVLLNATQLSSGASVALIALVIFSSYSLGCFLENRTNSKWLELLKALLVVFTVNWIAVEAWLNMAFVVATVLGLILLYACDREIAKTNTYVL